MSGEQSTTGNQARPPIVGIFGHVDHGKSTLLDFIRKSNIVSGEAGGITQHIGAYQASHNDEAGIERVITFIDTPGHAAFTEMRSRGARVADIAVLVVAADDGVKAQTLEALESIKSSGIPYIIAINKIDKPGANVEVAKQSLVENGIYVEGYGGDIPVVNLSAKTGEGVSDLLDMIILMTDLEDLHGNPNLQAKGLVIESHKDPKKGIYATLIIQNGTLHKGDCLVVEGNVANVRTMINYNGNMQNEAGLSEPIEVTGFSEIPEVGSTFESCSNKKEAEDLAKNSDNSNKKNQNKNTTNKELVVPIVIKSDTAGTLEAVIKELSKLETDQVGLDIISSGVGNVSESDLRLLSRDKKPVIIAFNVKLDSAASDLAISLEIPILTHDIIYKASEELEEEIKKRLESINQDKPKGNLNVIKVFNGNQKKQVIGGEVIDGIISVGDKVNVLRKNVETGELESEGRGRVSIIQHKREEISQVEAGKQCGMEIEIRFPIEEGDILQALK